MTILIINVQNENGGAGKCTIEFINKIYESHKNIKLIVFNSQKNSYFSNSPYPNMEVFHTNHVDFAFDKEQNLLIFLAKFILRYIRYRFRNYFALKKSLKVLKNKKIDIIYSPSTRINLGFKIFQFFKNAKYVQHVVEYGTSGTDYNLVYLDKIFFTNKSFLNSKNTHFVANSNSIRNHYISHYSIPDNKIITIYNGINPENYPLRKPNTPFNKVLFLGYVIPTKGHLIFLKFIKLLSEKNLEYFNFFVIGSGPAYFVNKLKKTISKTKLNNKVSLLGYRKTSELRLNEFDLGVVFSRSEAFGRITIEYSFSKLIPIVSDSGANKELINNTKNGFIFSLEDSTSFDDILTKIRLNKLVENNEIADNAYLNAIQRFSINLHVENFVRFFNSVV
jgi:glycosyltransferase involved in cell wall biosynthesis